MSARDDELLHLEGGEPAHGQVPRLAAALVLQAQALEALRAAHGELLARLDQGPERQALVAALDELRQSTDRVREAQARAAARAARARRRVLLAGGAGLVLLLATGGLGWRALDARLGLARQEDAARAEGARVALDGALAGLRVEQQAALAGLAERLDLRLASQQLRLEGAEAERDAARREAETARTRADELERERDALVAREAQALADARRERDLRLESLGDAARLREQLQQKEQGLHELAQRVSELQTQAPPPAIPAIVPSVAAAAGLAARLTAALRASGVPGESVVEIGAVADGALQDLLLLAEGRDGAAPRVRRAARATLEVDRGRPVLRLTGLADAAGALDGEELLPLPALDRAAFERLGLAVPPGAVSLARLREGLAALLAPHGWSVARLGGWSDGQLLDLRLELLSSEGRLDRALEAARASVLPGPELDLLDGTLTAGGESRPFFQGRYRLPLPAGDLAAFDVALRASGP